MKRIILLLPIAIFSSVIFGQSSPGKGQVPILLRLDDIGMSHSVNMAAKAVLETGIPVSMSVMVPCSWFPEAAAILKQYPHVSVGIHLTLNSEWKQYRWGPVAGATVVQSLVDSLGYFFPSRGKLFDNNPKLTEIETELRAQIEKALAAGLKLDYLDYHMGAAVQTPETRAIVEKLANEYNLGISRYFGEVASEGWYFTKPADKADSMLIKLGTALPGRINLFVLHVGYDDAELAAMEDANPWGPKEMSKHRNGELDGLLSPRFLQLLRDPKYRPVNYRMIKEELGPDIMKRPS